MVTPEADARVAVQADIAVLGYVDAIPSLDEDHMLPSWADVNGFAMAADGELAVEYEGWVEELCTLVESIAEITHFEMSKPQIYVLAGAAASCSMKFEWSMKPKEGEIVNCTGSSPQYSRGICCGRRSAHHLGPLRSSASSTYRQVRLRCLAAQMTNLPQSSAPSRRKPRE